MIQFACECGRQLQAREEHVGLQVKCPACGQVSTVPGAQAPAPPREPPPLSRPEAGRSERREDDRDRDRGRDRDRDRDRGRDRDEDEEDDRPRRRRPEGAASGTSGKATASLILGLLSFPCLCNLFTGLPAILFASLALLDISKSGGRLGGKVLAWIGLVTGCLGTLCVAPTQGYLYWWKIPELKANSLEKNNLKQITLAMHNYNDTYGGLPQAASFRSVDGKPLLSWRVALLPFIEESGLYRSFNLEEPWDSPHNIKLLSMIPKTYQQPGETDPKAGLTRYQLLVGPDAYHDIPFGRPGLQQPAMKIPASFQDGTSNTILVATAEQGVPWTKPVDLAYDAKGPLPQFSKRFSGGFNVGMADGSVHVVSHSISEPTLRAAITPSGGEMMGPDW